VVEAAGKGRLRLLISGSWVRVPPGPPAKANTHKGFRERRWEKKPAALAFVCRLCARVCRLCAAPAASCGRPGGQAVGGRGVGGHLASRMARRADPGVVHDRSGQGTSDVSTPRTPDEGVGSRRGITSSGVGSDCRPHPRSISRLASFLRLLRGPVRCLVARLAPGRSREPFACPPPPGCGYSRASTRPAASA